LIASSRSRPTDRRGQSSIEFLLIAALLVGMAMLSQALGQMRLAHQMAWQQANERTLGKATGSFSLAGLTGIDWPPVLFAPLDDDGLPVRGGAPRGWRLDGLPTGVAVGRGERTSRLGRRILRARTATFEREAAVIRPAWTWRAFWPWATTQTWPEGEDVNDWYLAGYEATLKEYRGPLKLAEEE